MRPKKFTVEPYATTDADAVAASQTPAAGGVQSLSLVGGGPVTLDFPRQIHFTFASSEVARTFVVIGTSPKGGYRIEAVAGAASVAQTVQQFATVTEVKVDGDTAGAVQVGTNLAVDGDWYPVDWRSEDVSMLVAFTGITAATNADFTLQYTLSDLYWSRAEKNSHHSDFDLIYPSINDFDHDTFADETDDGVASFVMPVTAIRWQSNAVFTGNNIEIELLQQSAGANV